MRDFRGRTALHASLSVLPTLGGNASAKGSEKVALLANLSDLEDEEDSGYTTKDIHQQAREASSFRAERMLRGGSRKSNKPQRRRRRPIRAG